MGYPVEMDPEEMTRTVHGGSNHNLELVSLWGGGRWGGNMILSISSNHSQISDCGGQGNTKAETGAGRFV